MATQLQRALGFAEGKEPVPRAETSKPAKKEPRSDKKGSDKGDPFPNLPRRRFGIDQES